MMNVAEARAALPVFEASDTLNKAARLNDVGSGKGTMALVSDFAKPGTGAAGAAATGILRKLTPLAGIVCFLLVWQIFVVAWGVPWNLLPSPSAIGHAFINQLPLLLSNGWITVYEMLAGYALAVGIAIPLAIAITSSRRFNQLVMPTMLFFQIIPKVAIAPLFLVWFGVGPTPKILVAFLISFFPIVIDAAVGLRSMSSEMTDLARSMGATRMQVFARFRLPTKPAVSVQRPESGGDIGDRRHGGRRIRRRRQRPRLSAAGDQFEHGSRAYVRYHRGTDHYRSGFLLLR